MKTESEKKYEIKDQKIKKLNEIKEKLMKIT